MGRQFMNCPTARSVGDGVKGDNEARIHCTSGDVADSKDQTKEQLHDCSRHAINAISEDSRFE